MEKNLVFNNFYAQLKYNGVYNTDETLKYFECKGLEITLDKIISMLENEEYVRNNFKYKVINNGRIYIEKEKDFPKEEDQVIFLPYFYNVDFSS